MSTLLYFPQKRLVVIDVDTTGVGEKDKLIAVHGVEVVSNKLTGVFFHIFMNKRNNNKKEYMDYFSDYEYDVDKNKKKIFFLNSLKVQQ